MSQLSDYLLGQIQHKLHSIASEQEEISEKLDSIAEKIDETLSWAQRLIWLGLAILGTMGLNWSPDKLGEVLATALRGLK
jgi:hypothetical protein